MTACANCGQELPEGAVFCPDCGARALDYSLAPDSLSPSHFNTGMTATASPSPADEGMGGPPPMTPPLEDRKKSSSGRTGLLLVAIGVLIVILFGATLQTGIFTSGSGTSSLAVNSPSDPFTGQQLYAAYASNQTKADASYTNKTVYIQDSLDFGAVMDLRTGQYYSYVDSGAVLLFWSNQSQVSQLYPGAMVLAECSVGGVQASVASSYVLSLQNCDLISVQSGASSVSISVANA